MVNKQIHRIKSISEYHRLRGLPKPEHPLISLVDYSKIQTLPENNDLSWIYDFYSISLKKNINGKIKYGHQEYDFDEGTMFFIAPGQVFRIEANQDTAERSGLILLIHPDFLWEMPLAKVIKRYEYFGYSVREALFLSEKEEAIISRVMLDIQREYHLNIDHFSQQIIGSHIEVLLNYAERFYHRQFLTRKKVNHEILDQLEATLTDYFLDKSITGGLPTVQYVADKLNLSPDYLSSLLKVATGQNTQQHIHDKLIEKAKEKLSATELSVSEIAYQLGFEHPQSFSKLFKTKTSLSPLAFRASFN